MTRSDILETFTPDAASQLPGPEWMEKRRTAAAEEAARLGPPSTDEEVWRYSRVGDLDLDRFSPVLPVGQPPAGLPAASTELLGTVTRRSGFVVLCNGRIMEAQLDAAVADQGVTLGLLADRADGGELLGSVAGEPTDAFSSLNEAFAPQPFVIEVPAGVRIEHPIVVHQWTDTADIASFTRLLVIAGEGSEVEILDQESGSDVAAFNGPVVELDVGRAARVRYLNVQDTGDAIWRIGNQASRVGRDATLVSAQAALGGWYARTRADCRLEGTGGSGDLLALYFGEGDQMLDFRTFQDHVAPDTTSDLVFKGAVTDRSKVVYTGLIHVGREASGTNAYQTNRNLKLGDEAWAESVPNLEIETNDVKCSHASTVGPIDEEQRFYLESRGVPPVVAERLVVSGFFGEVLERLPVEALVPSLRDRIVDRLREREES
ncbi:MAG: Fe-S cluster assembly protein SufD [Acidimicrobiia bacterium]|nr:Fe-S cluster assembly protein SufD [Acidimicrobiia bacterium]